MSIFDKIIDNSIVICPLEMQSYLIKQLNENYQNLRIKFLEKNELLNNLRYQYDLKSLVYLKKNYNYELAISKEILDNLRYLELNKDYQSSKLQFFQKIFQRLYSQKLFSKNELFEYLIKNKKVYVYGYSKYDIELYKYLEELQIEYTLIERKPEKIYSHTVEKFETIDEEVNALFRRIGELIKKGVDINDIFIYDYPSEYELIIQKYAWYHQIVIESKEEIFLYNSPICKNFISLLNEHSFKDSYTIITNDCKVDSYNAIDEILNIVTELETLNITKTEKIELFIFLSKNKKLHQLKYNNSIRLCNSKTVIQNKNHIFMLGFSLGEYPKIIKDEDFYMDFEKEELISNTSNTKSQIEEDNLINFINYNENIYISYKEKSFKSHYYPSLLIEKLGLKKANGKKSSIYYSDKLSKLQVAHAKDMKNNFNIDSIFINTYTDDEIEYKKYDHQFKKLTNYNNLDFMRLSYTSINQYNRCPFSYFVSRILKVNNYELSFSMKIGNLYHLILKNEQNLEFDLSKYNEMINELFVTNKEKFFANKLLPQVFEIIKKNLELLIETKYKNIINEQELEIEIDDLTTLVGKIDRFMIDELNKKLIIIDYKTNNFKFEKEKIKYGIDMQLPIYAYLLNEVYKEYGITGMYIQNVCLNNKDLLDENRFKYLGITINNIEELKRFEPTLGVVSSLDGKPNLKSKYIKGCRLISDGKDLANRGYTTKEEIISLIETAKDRINTTSKNIRMGVFNISPIKFKGEVIDTCKNCDYKDVCYAKSEDVRIFDLKGDNVDEI